MKHTNPDEAHPEAEPIRDFPVLRLDPELRLCPQFDSESIALFPVATREEMSLAVLAPCTRAPMLDSALA